MFVCFFGGHSAFLNLLHHRSVTKTGSGLLGVLCRLSQETLLLERLAKRLQKSSEENGPAETVDTINWPSNLMGLLTTLLQFVMPAWSSFFVFSVDVFRKEHSR